MENFGLLSVNSKFGGSKGNLCLVNLMSMLSSISRPNMQLRRSASGVLLEAVGIGSVNSGLVDLISLVMQIFRKAHLVAKLVFASYDCIYSEKED